MRIIDNLDKYMKFRGLSDYEVTKKCDLSQGLIGKARKEGNDLGKKSVEKILLIFDEINRFWLLTGEGSMLVNSSASEGEAQPDASAETLTDENSLKYYYELAATASNIEDMADNELHQPFRRLLIPGFEGTTAFTVTGDSMEPTAKAGDIVAIDRKQAEVIVNGEIYFIVTRDGQRMIKRLVRHDGDDDGTPRFSCISDNADKSLYAPFLLSGDNIHTLHRVVGFISISHLG